MPIQSLHRVIEVSAGFDYGSFSSPKNPLAHLKFVRMGEALLKLAPDDGSSEGPSGIKGYRGRKRAGVSFAHRASDNHYRIVVEGPNSDFVIQTVKDSKIPTKATRLDAQATYKYDKPFQFYATWLQKQIRKHEAEQGVKERTAFTLFEKSTQDSGATIGDRSSAIYPRIYDPELYHHGKSLFDIWKSEVEAREEAARRLWEMTKATDDHSALCLGIVTGRLAKHGIVPRGLENAAQVPLVGTKDKNDFDTWLKWFEDTALHSMEAKIAEGRWERIYEAFARRGFIDGDGAFLRPMYV